ncbi:Phenylalanyl-tRNA synthetase class IIc beta subunit archae/euk cytosolic [Carpediemonas membranifera]|uniref:phenylalanine--tRNA ligase n=1 Tax=Carpediemonas membranifera TaxID=201153 RepID=A0A8J6E8X9_9EUKA|nr:Phenylalanyl-tRNA synthetase class IIc beta subunit archae/euk cytosolic [Carpediemonas membranifera]|eukprot:KAG9392545.1 Phenylalanyl-tRNA synthetase class IIc beta subunit archae/euk cytosolic [Carpediemonas membranifera]
MPTISVPADLLLKELHLTDEKSFDKLSASYGLELDDVVVEDGITQYKVDVPANRPELCCAEGMIISLNAFTGTEAAKPMRVTKEPEYTITVDKSADSVRPYIVGAILRDVTFTKESYASFIDFQDKLHHNICRRRALVAIGTHDLDKIEAAEGATKAFTYRAVDPVTGISFAPLNQIEVMNGKRLMEFYEADAHLKEYLPIIRDSPLYPTVRDGADRILSLPPIINSDYSKMSADTKNVFIECTATDLFRAKAVINTIVGTFSRYCKDPFTVEPVLVKYNPDCSERQLAAAGVYPDLAADTFTVQADYINRHTGLDLAAEEWAVYLRKMMHTVTVDNGAVHVKPCVIRTDVLHACDVVEDAAIAYGFGRIPTSVPEMRCTGGLLPINRLTELLRVELAGAGYSEALAFVLCSTDETSRCLEPTPLKDQAPADPKDVALIANSSQTECQAARNNLLCGLLKTVAYNKSVPRPLKLFEVSDVVLLDPTNPLGAKNERRVCVLFSDEKYNFEVPHGVLSRVATVLGIPGQLSIRPAEVHDSRTKVDHLMVKEGRAAVVEYKGKVIGSLGWVHPNVLANFDINYPCSCFEITLEPFVNV